MKKGLPKGLSFASATDSSIAVEKLRVWFA